MNHLKAFALAIVAMVCFVFILTGCKAAPGMMSEGGSEVAASDTVQATDTAHTPDVVLTAEPAEPSEGKTVIVSVDYATEDNLRGFDEYVKAAAPDVGDYDTSVDVLFSATATARDFSITRIYHPDYFRNKSLFSDYTLSPDEPLVFSMVFYGDLPPVGISYLNENDEMKYYYLTMSGDDGSLILIEADPNLFEYPNTPSQKLFDFTGLFIPYTTLIPENKFSRENPPKPFNEYEAGTPLTYEELLHFSELTDSSDTWFHI